MKSSTFASRNQRGNVLFLILIAVALFAALSYAVTQSSRSGGDASRETTLINTSQLTQYPNQVRTAVLRLVINGNDPTSLQFTIPAEFTDADDNDPFDQRRAVFHPEGGAASYQTIPAALLDSNVSTTPLPWKYSLNFEIPEIGTSSANSRAGNDLIAFADGVSKNICARVNRELGYGDVIAEATAVTLNDDDLVTEGSTDIDLPDTETVLTSTKVVNQTTGDETSDTEWFFGKAFGCFQNGSGNYVYYHVLVER